MRLLINIIKWIAIVTGALLLILFSLSFLLRNRVTEIFLASVNRKISTKVLVGEYRLSFLKKFPKASVELKDLTILSSHTFDKNQFKGMNTDTLLNVHSAFLEFGMTDILNGNYTIGSITVANGMLNLFSDSSGGINYDITYGSGGNTGDDIVINLDRISVSNLTTRYVNRATSLDISGSVESGRFKSRIAGNNIDFTCNSSVIIRRFDLFSASVRTKASLTVDMNLHKSDSGYFFRKGNLSLEDFRFGLSGYISSTDSMNLKITGRNIQLSRLKKYLPEKFASKFSEYSPSGLLKTECTITGPLSRKENPEINIFFSLEKGNVQYGKSGTGIKDLTFAGSFSNGLLKRPESFRFIINDYHFTIGSTEWSGNFHLTDFTRPAITSLFAGEIIPAELNDFVTIPGIRETSGSFRINLLLSGIIDKKGKYTLSDIIELNPEADIRFNSFGLKSDDGKFSVDDVDGNMMIAKNLWAEELYFTYLGQRFRINGEFSGLPAWLAGKPAKIKVIAEISADNLSPLKFITDSSTVSTGNIKPFSFPDGIDADISFSVSNLEYKSFKAENVTGTMHYLPGRLDFRSLKLNALNGNATGDCFIIQNRSKSFISHGNFSFEDIDINLAFKSFNNFGQNFIKSENLAGSLSGTLSILMPLDSLLNPDAKTVTAEGKYVLTNGTLNNFEPVKALSGFIEVSELENITFSRLENDLFIRNNYVAIPQMDIKSSAADFTVSGKHSFDNSYEYHVKTYLSEILSRKARKGSRYSNEFGAVEEDGLGRSSLFLKVAGTGEDIKVSYDLKAAGNNIKQNLRKEKINLKSILNEEYGWFRRDSTAKPDYAPKPKFRISFPETDTSSKVIDTLPSEKDRRNNRIFKRKIILDPNN